MTKYTLDSLLDYTPIEVADTIAAWRMDDEQLIEASFDLLNAIEMWLRGSMYYAQVLESCVNADIDAQDIFRKRQPATF